MLSVAVRGQLGGAHIGPAEQTSRGQPQASEPSCWPHTRFGRCILKAVLGYIHFPVCSQMSFLVKMAFLQVASSNQGPNMVLGKTCGVGDEGSLF